MKKAFIQKLSIAMASALVITAAAPATADAAAAMKMNRSSKILYLNEDNMTNTADTYDFSISNKPSNYKTKYSFSWYAENDKIVDVAKGGVVTAKKVGQTTVKCDIIKKSTGKVYKTVKATVTVKANAETVTINNAPENGEIAVGTTFDFNRTMKAANGGKATDKTEWVLSADKEGKETTDIASVDKNGVVTALKAGTFYITAKTYQSASAKDLGYTAVSEAVEVKVPLQLTGVNLTKVNTIELTFDSSVKDVVKTASDVKIQTVASSKVNYPVKSVAVSEDGKTVTVVSYQNFVNDTTYSITAADSTKEFTAKIGTIANIIVENQVAAPIGSDDSKAQTLKYKVTDANGVDLTDNYSITGSAITVSTTYNNGSYVGTDGKMYMRNKGDVVTVQLTYAKYNTTTGADESIKSNVATITAAEATATTTSKWTIAAKDATSPYDKTVTSVNAKDNSKKLYVTLKDSYNNDIQPTKYESLNTNILLVDNNGNLYPQAAGTAIVKVESGNYVDYLTIVVNPEATVAGIVADTSNYSLSNTDKLVDSKTIGFKLKDIYGETASNVNSTATVQPLTSNYADFLTVEGLNADNTFAIVNGEGSITFKAKTGKTGSASFKVTAEGKATVVTISVVAPAGAVNYRVDLSASEVDNFDASKSKTVLTVYNVDAAGTLVSQVSTGTALTYAVKNANGETKLSGNFNTTNAIEIDAKAKDLAAGIYTVEVTVGPVVKTAQFTVKSSKKAAAVVVKSIAVKSVGSDLNTTLAQAITFKVDGNEVTATSPVFDVISLDTDVISGGSITWTTKTSGKVYVNKVTFTYAGVTYEAAVNQIITVSLN